MKILRLASILFLVILCGSIVREVFAESDLEKQIKLYEQKITELQGEQKTLSQKITYFNSQISLTELRINYTKSNIAKLVTEIDELNSEIDRLEELKTKRLELVLHRIPQTYKRTSSSQFGMVFFSKDFSDFLFRMKYLMTVQQEDTRLYRQLQNAQDHYNESKEQREKKKDQHETLKKQLELETAKLLQQKREKQTLLDQTKNSEGVYQQLLSQARAQLASMASYASSRGGGVLSGQTSCGDWGCYYNQRDSQWAYTLINGSNDCGGPCNMQSVGCLVTSVAMVASHMGRKDILPGDIAVSDPSNFSVGTALLRKNISVKGANLNRTLISSSLSPDSVSNGPVIVGIYYGKYGTHFVVVKSYKDGTYIMNDPYEADGHDISFTSRYSLGSVFSVERVSM